MIHQNKNLERQDAEAEVMRKKIKAKAGNGGAAGAKQAPKKPRKNITKPSATTEPIAIDSETVQEVSKLKPKGRKNKSKSQLVSVEGHEDEDLVSLKQRLAAYNLDSSAERLAIETEIMSEAAAAARKAMTIGSDEDTATKVLKGKKRAGGGRKPANATKANQSNDRSEEKSGTVQW